MGIPWPRMAQNVAGGKRKETNIEKKWPRMPPEGNTVIENGKRQFFVLRKIMVSILRPFLYRKNIEKMY